MCPFHRQTGFADGFRAVSRTLPIVCICENKPCVPVAVTVSWILQMGFAHRVDAGIRRSDFSS